MLDVWKSSLVELEQKVPPESYSTWFSDTTLVSFEDNVMVIGVKNIFQKKQLESRYRPIIREVLENSGVKPTSIQYEIVQTGKNKIKPRETTRGRTGPVGRVLVERSKELITRNNSVLNTGLNKRYTLDNFVVGSNNDLAVSVAKGVIEKPGSKYNPFFLYGGSGLGKTHLVQAIGNALLERNPKLKILYIPINHFYSEFISLIQKNRGDEFTKKYRSLDVLIIDDFQLIVGKQRSQEQFFNIFNDMYNLNKQIIVTSDRLPSEIKTVDERLASRLTWAGAIDLQMPNFEDKCAILKAKVEFEGKEIEDEAIEYIAENVKTNIRDLEGELSTLLALSELKGISPLELINDGYVSSTRSNKIQAITPKQVVSRVAKHFQLTVKEMCSKSRVTPIKNARHVAMYLLSRELGMSLPKIAREVGVKDHTTVLHGVRKIENDMKLNFGLREQIDTIRKKLYE